MSVLVGVAVEGVTHLLVLAERHLVAVEVVQCRDIASLLNLWERL